MNFEHLLGKRLPVVYTTKIDDMAILKKDMIQRRFQDVVELIIAESKPSYKNFSQKSSHLDNIKSKNMYYRTLKLKRRYSKCTKVYRDIVYTPDRGGICEPKVLNDFIDKERVNITKIGNKITNESHLKSLLALCRPLRIVLQDIRETASKHVKKVLSSEGEELHDQSEKVTPENKNINSSTKCINVEDNLTPFCTIKDTDDYKNFLDKQDLKNTIIVIYNTFLQKLHAYEIDDMYAIVNSVNAIYTRMCEFRTEKRVLVVNIIVCCWKKRRHYISILNNFKQYRNIAKYMHINHPCKKKCQCCCLSTTENENDKNFSPMETGLNGIKDITKSVNNNLSVTRNKSFDEPHLNKKTSHLITQALNYKKISKWNRHKEKPLTFKSISFKKVQCNTLLELHNSNGITEHYELGPEYLVYSKVIHKGHYNSNWLSQTQSQPQAFVSRRIKNPREREKLISVLKNSMNISLSNYLAMPISKSVDYNRKIQHSMPFIYSITIEHTKSFNEARNPTEKVLSIVPEYITPEMPVQVDNQQIGQLLASAPNEMEKDMSGTIDSLIRNILYRFRDINLTINSEGKVSAKLNAPINNLSSTELKILSDILIRAQSQVNELGVIPVKPSNPDSQKELKSDKSKFSYNPSTNNSNKEIMDKNRCTPRSDESTSTFSLMTQSQILTHFSKWTKKKKECYAKAFTSLLCDKTEFFTPKIVNVFSLGPERDNKEESSSSMNMSDSEDHTNETIDNPEEKTIIVNNPEDTNIKTEYEPSINLLDNDTKPTVRNLKRKIDMRMSSL